MSGSDIRLGPWPDGLNYLDGVDQLRDTQLVDAINFDVDNTGVLVPRRAIRYVPCGTVGATKYLLGSVILDGETQPKAMVGSYTAGTSTFHFVGSPWSAVQNATVTRAGRFRTVVQYQNKIWYVPSESGAVGASSPAALINTLTAVATMPYGDDAFILKDRLFIVRKSTSELYFSKATDFTNWAAPDGGVIQVSPGDNQPITKVVVLNNQVVIFKRDSTWVLSFTSSPTGDGILRQVSADQGAIDAITYNNEIYCYNARSVFKFVNGFFQDIGLQLGLADYDTIDTSTTDIGRINVVGKTLIVGDTPYGNTYAMNLDTGAWTKYQFDTSSMPDTKSIHSRSSMGLVWFFGDGTTAISHMLTFRSAVSRTDRGSDSAYHKPYYYFRTKEYNFDDSMTWKRMYSWHLDILKNIAAEGDSKTYLHGAENNSGTDIEGLIGTTKSYRFKTTSFGYETAARASTEMDMVGISVRGIRAVIGAKAPVSV